MRGKNFIFEFFKSSMKGRNIIELPKQLFDVLEAPESLLLIKPIDISPKVKVGRFDVVLTNVPLIVGEVLENKSGFFKNENVIYNKDYVSFVYYFCNETQEMKIGINPQSIILKEKSGD